MFLSFEKKLNLCLCDYINSGQTRPVLVKRFVMQDTVEERLAAVRRTLQVDKPVAVAGTAVSGKTKEETTQLEMMEQLVGMAAK